MKKLSINKYTVLDISRGCIISIIISLIFVLILSLVTKIFSIDSKVIMQINQVIKILSIFGGCFFGFKQRQNGVIKGGIIGIFYVFISILVFGIIEHSISFSSFKWIDLIAGIVAGIISGILAVNIRAVNT